MTSEINSLIDFLKVHWPWMSGLTGLISFGTGAYKMAGFAMEKWKQGKAFIEPLMGMPARQKLIEAKVDAISIQLQPNGVSIFEKVSDIDNRQKLVISRLEKLQEAHIARENQSGEANFETDERGECTRTTPALREIFEAEDEADMLGLSWGSYVLPQERADVFEGWQLTVDRKLRRYEAEYHIKTASGAIKLVHVNAVRVASGGYRGTGKEVK